MWCICGRTTLRDTGHVSQSVWSWTNGSMISAAGKGNARLVDVRVPPPGCPSAPAAAAPDSLR
jgi:hypothetical protein